MRFEWNSGPKVLVLVLAGGEGRRLFPLTRDRAKPAVPFGGTYRLVDFVLSNFANAGYLKMAVLTQYKSHSLERHVNSTWTFSPNLGHYIKPVAAQMRHGPHWYMGSADAVYQNLNLIADERPDVVCVFGADHIYRMDPRQMVEDHLASGAGATVAAIRVPRAESTSFGVLLPDSSGTRVASFLEKPADPPALDGDPDHCLVSMGNYVFDTKVLVEALRTNAGRKNTKHDFGGDILPWFADRGDLAIYDFGRNRVPGEPDAERGYWRDVGTIDAYYDANMDLLAPVPRFNLYLESWPIHTTQLRMPPAKLVGGPSGRHGRTTESLLCPGAIVSGGDVSRSIVGPRAYVDDHAAVHDCILFDDVRVGEGAVLRRCVIDKQVVVPPGERIGVDLDHDRTRFIVSDNGIVVVPRGYDFTHHGSSWTVAADEFWRVGPAGQLVPEYAEQPEYAE